jgi:hypothetical protein
VALIAHYNHLSDVISTLFINALFPYTYCVYLLHIYNDSSVGIETGYGMDDREVGVQVPVGSRIFTSPYGPGGLGGHPNRLATGRGEGSFPRVTRPGGEADHSSAASAEVKKMWIYTSTPPYVFMA